MKAFLTGQRPSDSIRAQRSRTAKCYSDMFRPVGKTRTGILSGHQFLIHSADSKCQEQEGPSALHKAQL
eukprot:scaffold657084_cov38-Prasinocladus_malaysianus.AAC.2